MQIRTRGGRRRSRTTLTLPAAAAVAALMGAGIAVSGPQSAQAAEAGQSVTQKSAGPSAAELGKRVVSAMKADEKSARTLVRKPQAAGTGSAPTGRIIGGTETTISAAPWMAQLHFTDSTGAGYFCGGVVIAPTKVATAAHCVKGIKWYEVGAVVVGTDQLPTETGETDPDGFPVVDFHGGEVHAAYRQWNHPKYDPVTIDNDVAVLTLASPTRVPSLPLAQPDETALYQPGTDGKVYGWGRTSSTEPGLAQTLKVADADIVADADCSAAYPGGVVAGNMLCAGAPPTGDDATSETTCNGDSGGPLVAGGRLVGIVSWGDEDCSAAGKYGVYAKVSTYSAPIQARVDDANWNSDHTADLLARRTSDNTLFGWTSKVTSLARTLNHGEFGGYNLMIQADLDRDDYEDMLVRAPNGDLYWDHLSLETWETERKLVAVNWGSHKQILVPGDVTGDELPDMLAVDSTGTMRIYPGRGNGGFQAPVVSGTLWGQFSMVRGHGDFTNDGKPDILARGDGGKTYLYKGTGNVNRAWEAPVLVAAFGSMNALATTGDVNSDGHADVLARDTTGKLRLYPGNGNATGGIFGAPVDFGVGWEAYNLLG